jgi:hypothetical protein
MTRQQDPATELTYLTSTYLAVPGKYIWECPVIHRKPKLADRIERGLTIIPGIATGRANFWTGRIHITCTDEHVDSEQSRAVLAQCVDQVVRVCVEEDADGRPDAPPADPRDPAGMAAASLRLTRELAELLYREASTALQNASDKDPAQQSPIVRLWTQMRGVVRPPAQAPATPPEGEAGEIVVEPVVEPVDEGAPQAHAEPPPPGPNPNPLYASMPSLEPLVTGLAHSLIERYGEARIAELLETARTSSPTSLLQSLLNGPTTAAPTSTDPASPSAGRIIGGLFSRIGQIGSLLREAAKAPPPPNAQPPADEP